MILLASCGDNEGAGPDAGTTGDANTGPDIIAIPPGCVPERATTDRPDDHGYDQIRVLYVTPSDGLDHAHDTSDKICNSVRAIATWFQSHASAYLRFDTSSGLVDIGFVRLAKTDAQMRGTDPNNTSVETGTAFVRNRIEDELEAMGMIRSNKLYAVYYEGSSVYACGGGAYPPLIRDRVGAMYLGGIPPGFGITCGEIRPWGQATLVPNYIDYGILHELVHSMGFVPDASPNEHMTGHVFDSTASVPQTDLMYTPRTTGDPGWGIDAPDGLLLDLNNDDYFMSSSPIDLSRMTLLAPTPASPRRPLGW
jgi:hypothetical protein